MLHKNGELQQEIETLRNKNEQLTIENEYLNKTRNHKDNEISELHEKLEETNSLKVKNDISD